MSDLQLAIGLGGRAGGAGQNEPGGGQELSAIDRSHRLHAPGFIVGYAIVVAQDWFGA